MKNVSIRPRELSEIKNLSSDNQNMWVQGILDACSLIDSMYSRQVNHEYLLGDCILGKLNLLKKGKIVRKNPYYDSKKKN